MGFQVGDYVTRSSYNSDIIFKIEKIEGKRAILRGFKLRLLADAPLSDLKHYKNEGNKQLKKELLLESYEFLKRQQRNLILNKLKFNRSNQETIYREKPGRVLHIDGDKDYLEMSLQNYKNLQIEARGYHISEEAQPGKILEYLSRYKPDILVITGHDGVLEGKEYRTSKYFIKSVKIAREYQSNPDELVIFAGACQSSYQKLVDNGANFASSPQGGLIHFLDPVLIVEKVAYTSVREIIPVKEIIKCTISENGIGGIETRGKLRLCYP